MLFTTVPTHEGGVACATRDAFAAKVFFAYGLVTALATPRGNIKTALITANNSLAAKTIDHWITTIIFCKIAARTSDELRRVNQRFLTVWASCCCSCCCFCY